MVVKRTVNITSERLNFSYMYREVQLFMPLALEIVKRC